MNITDLKEMQLEIQSLYKKAPIYTVCKKDKNGYSRALTDVLNIINKHVDNETVLLLDKLSKGEKQVRNGEVVSVQEVIDKIRGESVSGTQEKTVMDVMFETEDNIMTWDGKGLPPVGVECEFYEKENNPMAHDDCNLDKHCIIDTWRNGDRLKVVAYVVMAGTKTAVVQNGRTEEVSTIRSVFLRPLRTEREKAIDEMAVFIRENDIKRGPASGMGYYTRVAEYLYDNNYRKKED